MSKCKSCGAELIWIPMASGKPMPCDAQKVSYNPDFHHGELTLVTPDGKIAKGNYDPDGEKIGYISHFATCPAASKHRKRDDGEQVSMI